MKKTLVIGLILGLVFASFGSTAAVAKKKKKKPAAPTSRVVEGTYENPAPGIGGVVTLSGAGGTLEVATLPGENYISVEIKDAVGPATYFGLAQEDTDGDGFGEIIYGGCTKTPEPLQIQGGLTHTITVTTGPGAEDPACPGIATSGTIKVTVSSTP